VNVLNALKGNPNTLHQGCTHFADKCIQEPTQNPRRQKVDVRQVPFWGSTNRGCHRENSFVTATWRPVFMHPCVTPSIIQEKQFWSRNTLASGSMGRFMKGTWDISYCIVKCRLQGLRKSWQLYFKQRLLKLNNLCHVIVFEVRNNRYFTTKFWVQFLLKLSLKYNMNQ
jgi:hypothetical protein